MPLLLATIGCLILFYAQHTSSGAAAIQVVGDCGHVIA
jgi:hypothetical protein